MREWLMIVNPNAGIGKAGRDWGHISELLKVEGFDFHTVFTEAPNHATELTREHIAKGCRKIVAVGGDGTMNEVVNGIMLQTDMPSTQITLGMIPVGTGNDWGRTYNIPLDYIKCIKVLKTEQTKVQDAGFVQYQNTSTRKGRFFINMAGLGFDGLVAKKTNADKMRGKGNALLYLKHLIGSLFSYKKCQTLVEVDGQTIEDKIFSIGIGIGQYNGGGMRQAPDAITDDGLFDLTLIKDISKWGVITNVRRLYDGTIKKHKQVQTLLGKRIRIESACPIMLEADGESLGYSPFDFHIIPQSLRVIVNQHPHRE